MCFVHQRSHPLIRSACTTSRKSAANCGAQRRSVVLLAQVILFTKNLLLTQNLFREGVARLFSSLSYRPARAFYAAEGRHEPAGRSTEALAPSGVYPHGFKRTAPRKTIVRGNVLCTSTKSSSPSLGFNNKPQVCGKLCALMEKRGFPTRSNSNATRRFQIFMVSERHSQIVISSLSRNLYLILCALHRIFELSCQA